MKLYEQNRKDILNFEFKDIIGSRSEPQRSRQELVHALGRDGPARFLRRTSTSLSVRGRHARRFQTDDGTARYEIWNVF
jgi:hypothetical protein